MVFRGGGLTGLELTGGACRGALAHALALAASASSKQNAAARTHRRLWMSNSSHATFEWWGNLVVGSHSRMKHTSLRPRLLSVCMIHVPEGWRIIHRSLVVCCHTGQPVSTPLQTSAYVPLHWCWYVILPHRVIDSGGGAGDALCNSVAVVVAMFLL